MAQVRCRLASPGILAQTLVARGIGCACAPIHARPRDQAYSRFSVNAVIGLGSTFRFERRAIAPMMAARESATFPTWAAAWRLFCLVASRRAIAGGAV